MAFGLRQLERNHPPQAVTTFSGALENFRGGRDQKEREKSWKASTKVTGVKMCLQSARGEFIT